MIVHDTFNIIASYSELPSLCSLAYTSREFYCCWNYFISTNSHTVSKYVQSLLKNNNDPEKIAELLRRFPLSSYNTSFELTVSHQQIPLKVLEVVAKKFPNLQSLHYKRPQHLPGGTPIRTYAALATSAFALPMHALDSITSQLAELSLRDLVPEITHFPIKLSGQLMRDLYLERICTFFPLIQNLNIFFKKSSGNFLEPFRREYSTLPNLTQLERLTFANDNIEYPLLEIGIYNHTWKSDICKFPILKQLRLLSRHFYSKGIIEMLPPNLEKLTLYQGLLYQRSHYNPLPEILSKCSNLVSLNLKNVWIPWSDTLLSRSIRELKFDYTYTYVERLFSVFPWLTKLHVRINNDATTFFFKCPDSIRLKELTLTLDLSDNFTISQLPSIAFNKYPNLTSFTIVIKNDQEYIGELEHTKYRIDQTIRKNGELALKFTPLALEYH